MATCNEDEVNASTPPAADGDNPPVHLKGGCFQCGGHVAFPAEARGSLVPCPHCGTHIRLAPMPPVGEERFLKTACGNCAGHLEFPESLKGTQVVCPHCHFHTLLLPQAALLQRLKPIPPAPAWKEAPPEAAPSSQWGAMLMWSVLLVLLVAAGAAELYLSKRPPPKKAAVVKPMSGLQVLSYGLDRGQDSGLVYLTGTVTNHSAVPYRLLRVEVNLLGLDGKPLGNIFDFREQLEPHGVWQLKALVLTNDVVRARLVKLTGEPPR